MVETRRLYLFEQVIDRLGFPAYLTRVRSEKYLRALAAKVWGKHGRSRVRVPSVDVIDGEPISYCLGYTKIVLATKKNTRSNLPHNNIEVLLHELTHAIGYTPHAKGFVRKYIQLLVEYGRCEEGKLLLAMSMFKIKH